MEASPAAAAYRFFVAAYAATLPVYFYYRWVHTVEWEVEWLRSYQAITCALELYGALNVLLLGLIRFRCPWAPACPSPPGLLQSPRANGLAAASVERDQTDVPAHCCGVMPREEACWQGPFVVSILIPCCSEPDDVIFGAVRAALTLRHPLASTVRVYLLDDGGVPSREEQLHRCAEPSRVRYVSRPKDPTTPRHGKAGNLNYTLRTVLFADGERPSAEQLVVIFDCDMEAHGDFLAHTLPYLALSRQVALVQTPQHFYNVAPAGDIFNHHNISFYQAMQPGLDSWGATVCCGTNFVARASALFEVGYFPTESITEDFLLSMKLAASGYVVRYHAAVVSTGEAPEDLRQIFKQRNRWCCGCFQVFFHPTAWRLLRRLRPAQALCYLNGPLSYLGTILTVPLWLAVPSLSLYSNIHPVRAITPPLVLLWLLYFTLLVLITEMMPDRLNRTFAAFLASKANAAFWWCFVQALSSAVVGRIFPSRQKAFEVTQKRGFSVDADRSRKQARGGSHASPRLPPLIAAADPLAAIAAVAHSEAAAALRTSGEVSERLRVGSRPQHDGKRGDALPPLEEQPRDTSQADVVFHQLVLSAALLFLVGGILRRCGAIAAVAGAHRRFGWENLGLALVPAAWLLLQAVPMLMVLAYARLPHGHRLHSMLVRHAWRAHYALIVFVCGIMVNAAVIHHFSHGPHHEAHLVHAQHASKRFVDALGKVPLSLADV
ncbi:hypothetical protein AB1Y20_002558 [Prymnesium parvum]|uniref:Glycosyltransferase 2-like domain-containing protein n=1 Tax=Prymnesium parvum TaxID=97485 RepID=A0AB34J9M2_PRYPA